MVTSPRQLDSYEPAPNRIPRRYCLEQVMAKLQFRARKKQETLLGEFYTKKEINLRSRIRDSASSEIKPSDTGQGETETRSQVHISDGSN